MIDRVVGIAASVGLDYHYETIHQTNTVLAHELLHLAKAHGRQAELKERLLARLLRGGSSRGPGRRPGRPGRRGRARPCGGRWPR